MLSCNSQWQPLNLNENRCILDRNREQYTHFRRGTNNRTLTTPSPLMTQPKLANRFHHFSHSTPETPNTHNVNGHFTSHPFQGTQKIGHVHYTIPFRMMNTSNVQQGFYQRASSRSGRSLCSTLPHVYYNNDIYNLIELQIDQRQYHWHKQGPVSVRPVF